MAELHDKKLMKARLAFTGNWFIDAGVNAW
jgi:hypothetical protein